MSAEKKKIVKEDLFRDGLVEACEGLSYISETDAEVVPFFGGKASGGTLESLIEELAPEKNSEIVVQPFEEFFSRLTRVQDWHAEAEKERVRRFLKLRKLLRENLKETTVLRIGRIRIDIYVVGVDRYGKLAGIRTKAVET